VGELIIKRCYLVLEYQKNSQFVANHGTPRIFPGKVFHFDWNTVPQPVAKRSFSLSDPGTFTYPMPMALIDSSSQWATR